MLEKRSMDKKSNTERFYKIQFYVNILNIFTEIKQVFMIWRIHKLYIEYVSYKYVCFM